MHAPPRHHVAMTPKLAATLTADGDLTVTRTLRLEDCHNDDRDTQDRTRIAAAVLRVVLRYSPDPELEDMLDAGEVEVAGDETAAVALERHVRRLAQDAESVSRGRGVVCGELGDLYLLDDYLRMKSVEQCDAFGHDLTRAEEDALQDYRAAQADELEQRIADNRRRIVKSRQVCRCGEDQGMHDVRARMRVEDGQFGRRRLPGGGSSGSAANCTVFQPILDVELRMTVPERVKSAIEPWLLDRGLENDDDARIRLIIATVDAMRRPDATHTVGEALAMTAAALNLPPSGEPIYSPKRRPAPGTDAS